MRSLLHEWKDIRKRNTHTHIHIHTLTHTDASFSRADWSRRYDVRKTFAIYISRDSELLHLLEWYEIIYDTYIIFTVNTDSKFNSHLLSVHGRYVWSEFIHTLYFLQVYCKLFELYLCIYVVISQILNKLVILFFFRISLVMLLVWDKSRLFDEYVVRWLIYLFSSKMCRSAVWHEALILAAPSWNDY